MIFHDIEQNTEIWDALRAPRITSSNLAKVMANYGKPFGAPAKKYAAEIAVSQITGKSSSGGYTNEHMQRGHDEEPLARMEYEERYFCDVINGGFFELDDIGCSPDGLVDECGVIEIKSAIPSVHCERISRRSFDPAYKWQLAGNLKFTEREYIDFISYCAAFPDGKRLYVYRCYKNTFTDEFDMIDTRLYEFRKLIAASKEVVLNSSYSINI